MFIAGKEFDIENNMYIMGILNVTKDSFSDGGKYLTLDAQLKQVEKMISEGADIIDIGGESTRPGYIPVSAEDEIEIVTPIIEKVKSEFDTVISLDTTKASVAEAGMLAGAHIINDVWGLKKEPEIAGVIKKYDATTVVMHNRKEALYQDLFEDICSDIVESLKIAEDAGICKDKIILDPGIGFAKTTAECLQVIKMMPKLMERFDYPWLMAASRKSVIGNTLNLPVDDRLEGTLAITAQSFIDHVGFVRVHDVLENKRLIDMLKAIRES